MWLFLSSLELGILTVGICSHPSVPFETREIPALPEQFLATLTTWCAAQGLSIPSLQGLIVVIGPGAFSAVRALTLFANSLSFLYHLPLVPLTNPERLPPTELLRQTPPRVFFQKQGFIIPVYSTPAVAVAPLTL